MPGPSPKPNRRGRNALARGNWQSAEQIGWRFGDVPAPPDGLKDATRWAWDTWFAAWFAAHWTPDDVPGLRLVIRMYDEVERGASLKAADKASLHTWMRSYGITPDGQAALRWARPKEETPSQPKRSAAGADRYAHLRAVNE